MNLAQVTEKDFETQVVKSELPVLVDFWAEWCGPCRMISPILEELARNWAGKLKIVKVNIDDEQELAARFNVMSIPTMLLFKNGQVVEQLVGAMPKEQLMGKIRAKL